ASRLMAATPNRCGLPRACHWSGRRLAFARSPPLIGERYAHGRNRRQGRVPPLSGMTTDMTLSRLLIAVAAMLVWTSPCPAQPAADRHPLARKPEVAASLAVLDAWIAATVAQREQPGLSIGIVYDQDLIWAKGYGYAELERRVPATATTIYRIASISKLFTPTAIMQLRDAGKLQLDDPVNARLSWFSIKKTYEGGPPITIRQLITHTSGLPREASGVNWTAPSFPGRDDMRRTLPGQETVFRPLTEWKYSNLAVSLAGEIVAEVSGEPLAQYVEAHILQPLSMAAPH